MTKQERIAIAEEIDRAVIRSEKRILRAIANAITPGDIEQVVINSHIKIRREIRGLQ